MKFIIFTLLCAFALSSCKTAIKEPVGDGYQLESIGGHYYKYFFAAKWNKRDEFVYAITRNIDTANGLFKASCWYYQLKDIENNKPATVSGITGTAEKHFFIEDRKIFEFLEKNSGESVDYTFPWYLYSNQYSAQQKAQFAQIQAHSRTQRSLTISEDTVEIYRAITHELHAAPEGKLTTAKGNSKLVPNNTLHQVMAIISAVHSNSSSNISKGQECPRIVLKKK